LLQLLLEQLYDRSEALLLNGMTDGCIESSTLRPRRVANV